MAPPSKRPRRPCPPVENTAMAPSVGIWTGFGTSPYGPTYFCTSIIVLYRGKFHSLNLVLQETARQVPIIRDSLEYLHRAAVLMGRSAKRKSILHAWSAAIKPICSARIDGRVRGFDPARPLTSPTWTLHVPKKMLQGVSTALKATYGKEGTKKFSPAAGFRPTPPHLLFLNSSTAHISYSLVSPCTGSDNRS